jgi:hypothetical protein
MGSPLWDPTQSSSAGNGFLFENSFHYKIECKYRSSQTFSLLSCSRDPMSPSPGPGLSIAPQPLQTDALSPGVMLDALFLNGFKIPGPQESFLLNLSISPPISFLPVLTVQAAWFCTHTTSGKANGASAPWFQA